MSSPLPKISIVTPSYNQGQFLEETILSVLDQRYPNVEFIIIDGGSTDGTLQVIERYSDRIAYWVSEKDRGQADAINKGWARCQGEIVAFINSDDYYLPGVFERVVAAFAENPQAGIVYGQAKWVEQDGTEVRRTQVSIDGQAMLDQFPGLPQPAVFLRREVLGRVGMLDASFHFALDGEFFVRAVGSFQAISLPEPFACMRLHKAAKSVATATGFAPEVLRVAQKVLADPRAYPRYKVDPKKVMAGAHVASSRFLYVNGEYSRALSGLWQAMRLSPFYRKQIVSREIPRFIARLLLGRAHYSGLGSRIGHIFRK